MLSPYLSTSYPWKDLLHHFDCVESTNTLAKEMAKNGAPHGTVLIADRQTGGRGRMGRSFDSPAGVGVYMSVILRPECTPNKLMHLTCAAAVAMCDAVEAAAGFRPGIKWTNDLVYEKRKLGGILSEIGFNQKGNVDWAILGIGINCCQQSCDFPEDIRDMAGSLSMVSGKPIDRAKVAAAMLEALETMSQQLISRKAEILSRYRLDCMTLNRDVVLVRGDEKRYGHALDIDDSGALVVCFEDGHTETVSSGEISVRGMYGYI
jgi:BirA family biotin operon repressor/biotin-[acetyl-CoA-carboxylase] ligase